MKSMRIAGLVLALAGMTALAGCGNDAERPAPRPETVQAVIGTGDAGDLSHSIGSAIAGIVNAKTETYRLRCEVRPSAGAVDTINAVLSGDVQFGIAGADRLHQAVGGLTEWQAKGAQPDLRACFALYREPVALVAAVDAGIADIGDLKGKRVNIGNAGSDSRQHAIVALEAAGLHPDRDILADSVTVSAAPGLLQEGRLDAFFHILGHPRGLIEQAVSGPRRVRLATLAGIDRLIAGHPYYTACRIGVNDYPGLENQQDVDSFGVSAVLVTAARVPEAVVYTVTREVFEGIGTLTALHPLLRDFAREERIGSLPAPLHPGALKYCREAGLIQ